MGGMGGADWTRLKDGFSAALSIEPRLRGTFVDHFASGHGDLRQALESLLREHEQASSALASSSLGGAPPTPLQAPSDPHFEILHHLGQGGMGIVYLARDRRHGAKVALKTIGGMNAASLLRLKHEFRSVADISHPNLARLFELRGDDGSWFFTMEYVDGVSFLQNVRHGAALSDAETMAPETRHANTPAAATLVPPLDVDRLRATLPQLVEGVAAIHAAGKLHCDLKPSNVLVDGSGRVVILDFGLVTEIDAPMWAASRRAVAGTVAFMSPEQARADPLSESSDWYSVGVMLYQALTGRLPIESHDLVDLLMRKQVDTPLPPRSVDPAAPEDLSQLCMQLLDRDPRSRPEAAAILQRLERRAPAAAVDRAAFVGRDVQLGRLHDALRAVRAGSQQTVYVHGSPGAGKSALVRHFIEGLDESMLVLTGRCYERESVPYKAFDLVMDALARRLAPMANVERLLTPDVAYLARVFPVLADVPAIRDLLPRTASIADAQEVRRLAARALRGLLRSLAGFTQLVIWIDDLQWSDLDSTVLLQSLLAPADVPRVLFIGSYRTEHAESSTVLSKLLEQHTAAERIHVGQLSDEEARALARSRLGYNVSSAAIEAVVREAGGVPLFVEQLVHALAESGERELGEVSFEAVLQRRFAALDATSRRLLQHVAVGGQPLPQAAIIEAAGVSPEQALLDVSALRAQQWIRTEPSGGQQQIEPFHDRIRECILEAMPEEELRRHHHALAAALEPAGVDPEILAVHWAGCAQFDRAARYARTAADRAAHTLAFNRAARLYSQALEWNPQNSADARTLEVLIADALSQAGRSLEAGDAYLRAAKSRTFDESMLFTQRAAEQYLNHGHVEKGYAVLGDLLRSVGLRMPKQGMPAVAQLGIERLRLWARGLSMRRGASAETLRRIDVCMTVDRGLSMIEPVRAAVFQTRACRLAVDSGDPKRAAVAFSLEAALEATRGHRTKRRVAAFLEQGDQLARAIDDVRVTAHVRFLRGTTHYLFGEWLPALECCRSAEAMFREHCRNAWWEIGQSASFVMWTLCHLGRLAEAASIRAPLLKEAVERGDRILRSQILTGANVLVPLTHGEDANSVREALEREVQPFRKSGYHMPHLLRMIGLCEIALYQNLGARARDTIEQDLPHIRSSLLLEVEFLEIEVLGQRARCALAAAAQHVDADEAYRTVRKVVGQLGKIGSPWAVAYAAPLHAELALRDGRDEQAVAWLKTAIAQYDALDMSLRAAACGYRLGQIAGGDEGRAIRAAHTSRMRGLGVTDAESLARAFNPH